MLLAGVLPPQSLRAPYLLFGTSTSSSRHSNCTHIDEHDPSLTRLHRSDTVVIRATGCCSVFDSPFVPNALHFGFPTAQEPSKVTLIQRSEGLYCASRRSHRPRQTAFFGQQPPKQNLLRSSCQSARSPFTNRSSDFLVCSPLHHRSWQRLYTSPPSSAILTNTPSACFRSSPS